VHIGLKTVAGRFALNFPQKINARSNPMVGGKALYGEFYYHCTPEPKPVLTKYSEHNDKELLALIAKNDKNAFAKLFNRYWKEAYEAAYAKVGRSEPTEEIVQEIFVRLWDKRASLVIENFRSYLFIAVRNRCLNYIASRAVEEKHWNEYKTLLPQTSDRADKELRYNDLLDQISEGIECLPQKTQEIFRLNRLEGRSVSEIASVLNLSEKAIEYHLTRSLKQLRTHLKDYNLILFFALQPFI
jgi:RNA polymerase sigma-70 factor (family 1)